MKHLLSIILCGITIIYRPDGSVDYEAINNQCLIPIFPQLPNNLEAEKAMG
jgi:hypothetical protein